MAIYTDLIIIAKDKLCSFCIITPEILDYLWIFSLFYYLSLPWNAFSLHVILKFSIEVFPSYACCIVRQCGACDPPLFYAVKEYKVTSYYLLVVYVYEIKFI